MLDTGELIVIFLVAFLVFGPKRLPELGRTLGKLMYEIRTGLRNTMDEMKTEIEETEEKKQEGAAGPAPDKGKAGEEESKSPKDKGTDA